MSVSVTCYAQPGKAKSRRLCEAFARGAGGVVPDSTPASLADGPAAFYGVVGLEQLWRAARARGGFYYMDNAYFDEARQVYFRAERDALQLTAAINPDFKRWEALGLEIKPWQRGGRHIVVVMQSDHFLREVAGWPGGADGWQHHVLERLRAYTDRLIIVRHWERDKTERAKTLQQEIDGAWAVVTHMSAAANEALLAGVPVFVTGPCAALSMGLSQLERIEHPRRPDNRREWAGRLAARQWTVEELESGLAWRSLNG